ncbi:MAG: chemotaxis protein CheX [Frankiaceae bacterium]
MTLSADSGVEIVGSGDIVVIAQDVWSSFLDLRLEPAEGPAPPGAAGEADEAMTGAVEVLDTWRGHIVLQCTLETARSMAAAMFLMERSAVGDSDVADALGELTNMIGGNIKSLLPAPSRLSLPVVHEGSWQPGGPAMLLSQVDFVAGNEGSPVRISVWQA